MAEYCDFGTAKDDCIGDRLVIGVRDKSLSKRLQLKEKMTLAESVKMVRQSEIIQDQLSIQNKTAKSIEEVNKRRYSKYNRESQTGKISGNSRRRAEMKQWKCSRCGLSHVFVSWQKLPLLQVQKAWSLREML